MVVEVMDFRELIECRVVKRLTRFTALVDVGGAKEVAYICNTGRLEQYLCPGKACYLVSTKKSSKLRHRLIAVEDSGFAALIDTRIHEEVFEKLISQGLIPWLKGFRIAKRFPRVCGKVFDYMLVKGGKSVVVELKSAVMRLPGDAAGYPDAETRRGREQLKLLGDIAASGTAKCLIIFICAIPKARKFQLYCARDKQIKNFIDYAATKGVVFKAISIYLDQHKQKIVLENPDLPTDLTCHQS
jgi:sugar fermentation stimulation protein A